MLLALKIALFIGQAEVRLNNLLKNGWQIFTQ